MATIEEVSTLHFFVNDRLVPARTAAVPVTDLAVQRGYGIFDFLKTVHGKLLYADEHLDRLYASAAAMHLQLRVERKDLLQMLHQLVAANGLPCSGIRITVTGGASPDGYSIGEPNLIISEQPLVLPDETVLEQGIPLVSFGHQRQLPHVKSIDYLMAVWLQPWIRNQGAADVLYQNQNIISECPRANIFMVNEKKELLTPAHNILKGITRAKLLQLAAKHTRVVEKDISLDEVYAAREVFITSTTKGILPVRSLDGHVINNGKAGGITRILFEMIRETWSG